VPIRRLQRISPRGLVIGLMVHTVCLSATASTALSSSSQDRSSDDTPSVHIDGVVLDWAGPYLIAQTRQVPDPREQGGRRSLSSPPAPLPQTDRIAANLGARFGIGFTIRGAPSGRRVGVRRVWHFPPITNSQTGVTTSKSENYLTCGLNETCFTGQFLRQEFELVPGNWTVEIWLGTTQLLTHSFELFRR
jgi:hypothetical protein